MPKAPFKPLFMICENAHIAIIGPAAALVAFHSGAIGRFTTKDQVQEALCHSHPSTAAQFSRAMIHNLEQVNETIETIDEAITHFNL